jgi:transposase-like protein
MDATTGPRTLQEAILHYSDLDVCQNELVAARWPDGVICPTCGSRKVGYLANQRRWQCSEKHPRRQFSVKVGTIFEDSPISLSKWFVAIWLIGSAKNGISSYELGKAIGITQKSAWFVLHRIRLAMQTQSFDKMGGTVEVDETFIGAKARNMHKSKKDRVLKGKKGGLSGKMAVMGILQRGEDERHSIIRLRVVPHVKRGHLLPHVKENVDPSANLYTDALPSYYPLKDDFAHKVIDHANKYVDGIVHTNGMENFWSLLKRTLGGTYVSVMPFHLFRYLDEQAYRFNSRKDKDADRFADMTKRVTGRRIMYKELIGHANEAGQTA